MSLPASLSLYGTVTAPAGGAAVVSIPNVPVGWYHLEVQVLLSGTPGAGDQDNVRIQLPQAGGGQKNGPQLFVIPTVNAVPPIMEIARFYVDTSGAVSLNAIGAGVAGSVYRAWLTLDPVYP